VSLKQMYCPFPNDATLIGAGERLIKGHNAHHTLDQFNKNVITPGTKSLKDVNMFQQLYIVAHGAAGADSIYDDAGAALNVTALAKQLKDQGLTNRIRKVKLYACQGGSSGSASTAKRLKDAMVLAGFNNVTAYGYTMDLAQGATTAEGGKIAYPYADRNDDAKRAKSVRVKF